jgi:putative tryptophan/tyrosine transport system substrate-binding protein
MRRREFITVAGGAAIAWPLAAHAQQPTMPVIGFVLPGTRESSESYVAPFRIGLGEAGYVDGRNVAIEYRYADANYDRLPALIAELVRQQVTVIFAVGAVGAVAAKTATTTVPIVFYMGEDPVSLGIIPNLSRPGGNLTGVATLSSAVMAKRIELLREIAPQAEVFAALINPKNPYAPNSTKEAQDAARTLGKDIYVVHASSESEIDQAFATLAQRKVGALLIAPDGLFVFRATKIAALATRHAIPASHERRAFPDAGGLMSYGASQEAGMRLAGVFAGRVLKGEKPADMPVMQPTKFELVINVKTAKALNLTVPQTLLVAADDIIE